MTRTIKLYQMIKMYVLYKTSIINWILIVLVHWNSSLWVDMSLHSDTLFKVVVNPATMQSRPRRHPLSIIMTHFQWYFSYIVADSYIGGGHQSPRRKPPTCRKSLYHIVLFECASPCPRFELTPLVNILSYVGPWYYSLLCLSV
jgi:hypothetical protein